jgi:hypothetical protein
MKKIIISKNGNYMSHGIGYTEHDGYGGTSDNRWSYKMATEYEIRRIPAGEQYQLEVNGVNKGTFTKN